MTSGKLLDSLLYSLVKYKESLTLHQQSLRAFFCTPLQVVIFVSQKRFVIYQPCNLKELSTNILADVLNKIQYHFKSFSIKKQNFKITFIESHMISLLQENI